MRWRAASEHGFRKAGDCEARKRRRWIRVRPTGLVAQFRRQRGRCMQMLSLTLVIGAMCAQGRGEGRKRPQLYQVENRLESKHQHHLHVSFPVKCLVFTKLDGGRRRSLDVARWCRFHGLLRWPSVVSSVETNEPAKATRLWDFCLFKRR